MPRITEQTKERQMELVWLRVKQRPHGISEQEIADATGIQRRTVNNYLNDLALEGKVEKQGRLWFLGNYEEIRALRLEVTPEEAYTYYLGSRLFVKQHDKRNRLAEKALMQLADALAANKLVGHEIAQAARELAQRPGDPQYETIFQKIVCGYLQRKRIAIRYKPLNGKPFDTTFDTYLMEPSAIGYATYIIGHSHLQNQRRAYKLERIEEAEILQEAYRIPDDFPGLEILRNSWSIIMGEETVKVVLRFSPQVKERVRETQWHPSQQDDHDETKTKEEWLLWWVQVADTMDMLPWIRSWGKDCEVVEPTWLRARMKAEVRNLAKLYAVAVEPQDPQLVRLLRCWGKTTKDVNQYHPALYHMLDVAHVAKALLSDRASNRWRRVLANVFDANAQDLINWIPYLVALHDIGKLSVAFQAANQQQWQRMQSLGFDFGRWQSKYTLHHTVAGQIILRNEWHDLQLPSALQRAWHEMVGGHHGYYVESTDYQPALQTFRAIQEPEEWKSLRHFAGQTLHNALTTTLPTPFPNPPNVSSAIMALTGFTILCDWIGSDTHYFKAEAEMPLDEYIGESYQRALDAVHNAGLFQATQSTAPTTFAELFSDCRTLRPLQAAIDEIPAEILQSPCLAIIEAPTGEGKTEAGFGLARRLTHGTGSDEFYCALPTMATSNQMFQRVQKHLRDRLGLPSHVKLVHGQALLIEDDLRLEPLLNGDEVEEHPAQEWFSPKKRSLLAPFGVGTIDQAELTALNVRHNALRMMGLAGKVVILDEVHAYDTYMTTIIEQMLRWLAALGSSVILLSATLPVAKRAALAAAYGAKLDPSADTTTAYPSLWVGSATGTCHLQPAAHQPNRTITVSFLAFAQTSTEIREQEEAATETQFLPMARHLLGLVNAGGCACWITNTVERAQKLYEAVKQVDPAIDCSLLHARFPLEERQINEQALADKFGPGVQERPQRAIVIGTQVLEQSLDVDFDVMLTDMAPIDLILQRAGRLHRHERRRPSHHATPHLWIVGERNDDGLLRVPRDTVYDAYILQQSWLALLPKTEICLPADYRPLIEAVYSNVAPEPTSLLVEAWTKLQAKEATAVEKARQRILNDPDPRRPFCQNSKERFLEDEESAAWIVAQTRLGEESITVIPLERAGDQVRLVPGDSTIQLQSTLDRADQLRLLRRSLRISQYHTVQALRHDQAPLPSAFKQSALLKTVRPLWLTNGKAQLTWQDQHIELILDPTLGLRIIRTKV
ncbi:MAG: CRISPR-associated helicase Cas3' [Caldilinea sp. CFX5]|nr:CRISPR-associated helicase Cas3' [Caldilinea sp. CFX5]